MINFVAGCCVGSAVLALWQWYREAYISDSQERYDSWSEARQRAINLHPSSRERETPYGRVIPIGTFDNPDLYIVNDNTEEQGNAEAE